MRWREILAAGALLAAVACGKEEAPREQAGVGAPQASTVEAGFCREHGVLEAVCTKCNPALVPVFQAKGDWCAEHGFPESFCPLCHPERGGKPAAEVSLEEAPADGTKIRFKTKETARLAGIEIATATEAPTQDDVAAVARLVYDATRVARVNARAPGVIRTIHVDVGSKVRRGAALAEIESAEVGADQAKLQAARVRVQVTEAAYQRAKDLLDKGIVPATEAQLAQQEWEAAKAEEAAAVRALRIVGTPGGESAYTLLAPLGGIVTQRSGSIGALVDLEESLFEIVDPSWMWAEIDVPEAVLPSVQVGQPVRLGFDALGAREFAGKIDYVAPSVDARTRTTVARVRLANPDGLLRANMYGRARIAVGDLRTSVVVPRAAVQRAKGVPVVFVRLAEDLYETRRVRLGMTGDAGIEIVQGVRPGEPVVTVGSFLLKTETLKGSIGAGCCEVEVKK